MIQLLNAKNVGIKMSGGADSALCAYLISKYIIENNLDIKVYPIVLIEEEAPYQEIFVSKILEYIESVSNFKFEPMITRLHPINADKIESLRTIETEIRHLVDILVSGTTHVPKTDNFDEPGTPPGRSGQFPEMWHGWIYTPLLKLDKREIAAIYEKYNLLDTLFPLTRSCIKPTNDFSIHCGQCWWCKERLWGFGRL